MHHRHRLRCWGIGLLVGLVVLSGLTTGVRGQGHVVRAELYEDAPEVLTDASGGFPELLEAIDRHRVAWLDTPGPLCATALTRWTEASEFRGLSRGELWILAAALVVIALAGGAVVLLRAQMRTRTRHLEAANTALRESEARYRSLFQNNHAAMLLIDPDDGAIVDANPAAARYYGWSRERLCQMSVMEINVLSPAEVQAEMGLARAEKRNHFFFRHRRADGSVRDVEVYSGPITLDERRLLYSIIHDITERREAERDLQASQALMQYIIKYDPNAISVLDRDLRYIFVSDRYLADYRVAEADIIGRHHYEVVPGIPQRWREVHRRALAGEVLRGEDDHFDRQDGAVDWTRWECRPWYLDEDEGEIGGIVLYTEVITERKRIEMALRKSENLLQRIFDVLPIGLWITDAEGRLVRNNPAGRRIWGASLRVGPEKYGVFRARRLPSSEWIAPEEWAINRTLEEGVTIVDELLEIDAFDGEKRVILNSTAPVLDETGTMEAAVIINQDITERQRATEALEALNAELEQRVAARTAELEAANQELEAANQELEMMNQELEAANRELETVNQELESFAYSVSHDLRAPLRALDGFSAALLTRHAGQLDAQGQHYLTRIQAASQRMAMLINDLLNLSRVTRYAMARERVDLSAIAREIVAELRAEGPAREVDVALADGMIVEGDAHLLRIAMRNLLDNAWKFTGRTPAPQIEIGMRVQAGECVYFVRDNGVGFDMAYVDKLFTPFQRLHAWDEFPGTGIGLVTVRRIVTRHGGRIWATAAEDEGATFSFTLGGCR